MPVVQGNYFTIADGSHDKQKSAGRLYCAREMKSNTHISSDEKAAIKALQTRSKSIHEIAKGLKRSPICVIEFLK